MWFKRWLFIALSLLALDAGAATGYRWKMSTPPSGYLPEASYLTNTTYSTGSDACNAAFGGIQAKHSGLYTDTLTSCIYDAAVTAGTPTSAGLAGGVRVTFHYVSVGSGPSGDSTSSVFSMVSEAYEYEDPCAASEGEQIDVTGQGGIPSSICSGGCGYTVSGVGVYLPGADVFAASGTGTGLSCTEGTSGAGAENAPADAGNDCFLLNGNTVCGTNTQGQYCGVVNDDYVCVAGGTMPAPTETGCISYTSGGVACGSEATNVPDNGTPGSPADPLVTVTDGNGTSEYYDPETAGNSSTPTPTGGTGQSGGSGGSGGSGSSSSASSVCMPGDECAGELPTVGEETDCTFTECAAAFVSRVQGAPLLQAVSGVAVAFPGGACPSWNLEAFGDSYSLSAPMCSIWEDISPFLSGVMLVIWGWVATRIVLSA